MCLKSFFPQQQSWYFDNLSYSIVRPVLVTAHWKARWCRVATAGFEAPKLRCNNQFNAFVIRYESLYRDQSEVNSSDFLTLSVCLYVFSSLGNLYGLETILYYTPLAHSFSIPYTQRIMYGVRERQKYGCRVSKGSFGNLYIHYAKNDLGCGWPGWHKAHCTRWAWTPICRVQYYRYNTQRVFILSYLYLYLLCRIYFTRL